jgi:EAL domain-containing protein (putative c-di-GMP-specific phosphodiesterase class I)
MLSPLDAILQERALHTYFQPIVSVKKHSVVGLEALSRGPARNGVLGDPVQLFQTAAEEGRADELDALCREQSLQQFAALPQRPAGLMLFLNVEADLLSAGRFSASALQRLAQAQGLRPQDIALELSAKPAQRTPGLRAVIETLQGFGFTVALEDVSASSADLSLLALLKPNIVKADQGLLHGLDKDPVRQEQLQSLFRLGHRLGALCVAEAVESEEQAAFSLEAGADLLQGHLYGRAVAPAQLSLSLVQAGTERSAARYKASLAARWQARQREAQRQRELMDKLLRAVAEAPLASLEGVLRGFVNSIASLECLYALDAQGRQLSSTITWQHQRNGATASLFAPAVAGADHSLKDYYLGLQLSERERFVSDPYVSLATGNLCRTLAGRFKTADGNDAIVCVDIKSM